MKAIQLFMLIYSIANTCADAQQVSRISFNYYKGGHELVESSTKLLESFNAYLIQNQDIFIERVHVFVDSGMNTQQAKIIAEGRYEHFKSLCVKKIPEARFYITSHKPCLDFKPATWERIDVYYRWTQRNLEEFNEKQSLSFDYQQSDPIARALQENELYFYRIEFVPGDKTIKSKSFPNLERVLDTLNQNKELHGVIQGHVCCYNKKWKSHNRAKVVYKHLVLNGVDKSRLRYKGLGNTSPLSETEATEAERQLNRRVDIVLYTPELSESKNKSPKHVSLVNFKKR